MAETFGALGRFQLYSITMVDLDDKRRRDLRTITLFMPNHSETVYERDDDDEEIPIGEEKPLSLIGPSRPCYPYDQLRIVFGDLKTSNWEYRTNYDKELEEDRTHQTITEYVKDEDSDSGALICFALLEEAIDAKLDFTYEDKDKGRVIRITEGEIYATTAGVDVTKVVLRSFGPTETSIHKKKSRYPKGGEEEEFYPGEPMLLDRSVLGLPLGEDLHITVNVKYYLVPLKIPNAGIVHGQIFETHSVPGPDSPNICNWDFFDAFAPGAKLKLKVTWSDNLRTENKALRLEMLGIAKSLSGKLSESVAVTGEKRRRLEGNSNKYQQE